MENNGQSARPGDPVHVRAHLGQWLRAYRTSLGDRVAPHPYHAQEKAQNGMGELSISALVATQDAMVAGYQAWAGGPCKRCEAAGPAAGVKGFRSVKSLGRRGKP